MLNTDKIYRYTYKITNLINGKIYIGMHKTKNLDDGYMGSGILIERAITKYGKENFKKEILEWFEDDEKLRAKEREIVNEEFVQSNNTYNISLGGAGCTLTPDDYKAKGERFKKRYAEDHELRERWVKARNDPIYTAKVSQKSSELWNREEMKALNSKNAKERWQRPEYRNNNAEFRKKQKEQTAAKRAKENELKFTNRTYTPEGYATVQAKSAHNSKRRWSDPTFRENWNNKVKQKYDKMFSGEVDIRSLSPWRRQKYREWCKNKTKNVVENNTNVDNIKPNNYTDASN